MVEAQKKVILLMQDKLLAKHSQFLFNITMPSVQIYGDKNAK
jgi:hypothetical protein